jgi:hypothetical protein
MLEAWFWRSKDSEADAKDEYSSWDSDEQSSGRWKELWRVYQGVKVMRLK